MLAWTCTSARNRDLLTLALLVAALCMLPMLGLGRYVLGQATLFILLGSVVVQWNLVFGVAGILSIGHLALFAVGGYATSLMGLYLGVPLWLTLPVAALAGLAMSLIMAVSTFRLRGAYVVVVTLAIAMTLYQLIVTDVACFRQTQSVCYSFSGGARGISRFGDFGFRELLGYKFIAFGNYYLSLAMLALSMLVAVLVFYSPYGQAFKAMRDNEVCASARGIEIRKYQAVVFAVSGVFTGLTGGIYAGVIGTFGPQVLELPMLLFLLSMMVVGGRGTIWGPVIGTAILALVDEGFRDFAAWRNTAYAVVLMVILVTLPEGLFGGLQTLMRRVRSSGNGEVGR